MQNWLKNTVRLSVMVSIILMGSIAQGSTFNIVLNYKDGTTPSAAEQAAFQSAEATWESLIVGLKDGLPDQSLEIEVTLAYDEVGGVLGSAGPTGVKWLTNGNYLYAASGSMNFDTADTATMSTAALEMVILHEMAHVIGFGTLWSSSSIDPEFVGLQELYVDGSGEYTGARGVAAFQEEFVDQGAVAYVPVEEEGGPGTEDAHWDEGYGGGATGIVDHEGRDMNLMLMSGWANPGSYISETTLGQFEDLGYDVVPEPATMILLGLGSTMLLKRRKRAA